MSFIINNRVIERNSPPFVMLEAGINHNGDLDLAKKMIKVAKKAGADAIKFQTFKASEFVGDPNLIFTYRSQGREVSESMLEMFRRYEFKQNEWKEIKEVCEEEEILFLSTPQNVSDMEFLVELGVPALKVGSDDFTNLPLLRRYSATGLPLIISCGMADVGEVQDALEATGALAGKPVLLMLCTSQYPTPPKDANLRKLQTLSSAFPGLLLGFSDHTQGPLAAAIACGFGACAFEKHFTLEHDLPGPDHWFSENPETATEWVNAVRTAHQLLGNPCMIPTAAEREMRTLARRSITAIRDIKHGEELTEENLGLRRPGNGLAPKLIEHFWGRKARRAIVKGEQLRFGEID